MPLLFRHARWAGISFVALGLLLTAGPAEGDPQPDASALEEPFPPPPSWLDRLHLHLTQGQLALAEKLDSFFPNPDNLLFDYQRSRLQIKLGGQLDTQGKTVFLQRLDGRLVLPRAQHRLSLYFSGATETVEAGPDPDRSEVRPVTVPLIEEVSMHYGFNTALRLVLSESSMHLVQYQLGVRLLPSFEPYTEVNGLLRFSLGKFLVRPGEDLFWRQREGFGETTRCEIDYPLGHEMILRLHTEGTVAEDSNGLEHRHFIAFLHQLSKRSSYTLLLETRGETAPTQRITRHLGRLTWKQKFYRDWLFVETGPQIDFAAENSFEPLPAVFILFTGEFK